MNPSRHRSSPTALLLVGLWACSQEPAEARRDAGGEAGSADPADASQDAPTRADEIPDLPSELLDLEAEQGDPDLQPDEDRGPDEQNDQPLDPVPELSPEVLTLSDLAAIQNPLNRLSYYVEWETKEPASTQLHLVCGTEIDRDYESSALSTAHSVFVMGLLAGQGCQATVRSEAGERVGTGMVEWDEVGPVPVDLPPLTVNAANHELMAGGWTLWALAKDGASLPLYFVLTDEVGRYRWYTTRGLTQGTAPDVRPMDRGILHGGRRPNQPAAMVSWEGALLWESPFLDNHHDVRLSPFSEGRVLYLSRVTSGCPNGWQEEGQANELDLATGLDTWTWSICDHYTPPDLYRNWSHLNSIVPFPGERAVLLSSREQYSLFKVSLDSGEIDWTFGREGEFTMAPEDLFINQHAPEFTGENRILIFDNGDDGEREYSRVIEFQLSFHEDGSPDAAERVWQYVDESLRVGPGGAVQRLSNGNTHITYSNLVPDGRAILREVTPEGETAWDLETPASWHSYRSIRLEDPPVGYVLPSD